LREGRRLAFPHLLQRRDLLSLRATIAQVRAAVWRPVLSPLPGVRARTLLLFELAHALFRGRLCLVKPPRVLLASSPSATSFSLSKLADLFELSDLRELLRSLSGPPPGRGRSRAG